MSQTQVQSGFIGDDTVTTAKIAANAITTAKLDSTVSNALVPIGGIIMWSGTITAAQALTGWKLCDGTNDTPDLRNKFIVGAHSGAGTGISPTAGPTFNATTGALSANYTPGNTGGEAAHQLTIAELASHNHSMSWETTNQPSNGTNYASGTNSAATGTFTKTTTSKGGDDYHENRPPYYALAFIMKVS